MSIFSNKVAEVGEYDSTVPLVPIQALRDIGVSTGVVLECFAGGSKVICNPPPTDTDTDYCVLVRSISEFVDDNDSAWEFGKSDYVGEGTTFTTCRRGDYNLLLFSDKAEYGACRGATALAKHLNIMDKAKRYALFEAVRSPWR